MTIVSRAGWGADPKSLPKRKMVLPATSVFVHHSVTNPTADPAADMRLLEQIGLARFRQFSYSYVISGDGTVLEGCGNRVGAHTAKRNSTSFGICWVGDYTDRLPKAGQIDATRELIAWLAEKGWLGQDYPIRGHRDVAKTACPGNKLYAALDLLRVPWLPPDQKSQVTDHPGGEDHMRRYDITISLDDQGNGWETIDVPADRIVSLVGHGSYPPQDGYWPLPTLGRQDRDGNTVITVVGGSPGGQWLTTVWAVD